MVTEELGDRKVETSERLAEELIARGSPLLAAYWEFREEEGRWTLILVPNSPEEERRLIKEATALLVEVPYRSVFSLSDPADASIRPSPGANISRASFRFIWRRN